VLAHGGVGLGRRGEVMRELQPHARHFANQHLRCRGDRVGGMDPVLKHGRTRQDDHAPGNRGTGEKEVVVTEAIIPHRVGGKKGASSNNVTRGGGKICHAEPAGE